MTEAVIWLVVWFVLAGFGSWLCVALLGGIGVGLATLTEKVWVAPVGVFLGWTIGVGWFIFAAIHVVLQVVTVVQLASH